MALRHIRVGDLLAPWVEVLDERGEVIKYVIEAHTGPGRPWYRCYVRDERGLFIANADRELVKKRVKAPITFRLRADAPELARWHGFLHNGELVQC